MPEKSECFICGDHRPNSLEVHHLVPQRYGGSDEPENLVQLCSSCHSAIEKLYDASFYERLGVEETEVSKADVDSEGTKIRPSDTIDRGFPPRPAHISLEPFCIEVSFVQFMIHSPSDFISDHYPESDILINRMKEKTPSIIEFFRSDSVKEFHIQPNDLRQTPMVKVVTTHNTNSPDPSERFREEIDTSSTPRLTHGFSRLHCGYCHTVYSEHEKADLAAHLRIKHRVQNPYAAESELDDSTQGIFSNK